MATVSNYGDIAMVGDAIGISVFGRNDTQLQVLNDGHISASNVALAVSGQAGTTSTVLNDKGGYLLSETSRAFLGSAGNDHLINAGVIRSNGISGPFSPAAAASLGGGNDIMEMIGPLRTAWLGGRWYCHGHLALGW